MFTKWTQHLRTEQEREDFESHISSAKPVLERLYKIIDEEEYNINRSELDPKTFDSPNWAYKQAFKNGQRAGLNTLKKLINLDLQEH